MSVDCETRRVLVVDDDAGMRMALEMCFSQRGWQVDAAAGRNEAITHCARQKFPLLVSDVRMPDGDGFEIMRAARRINPETAVILLTAFGSVPDAIAAVRGGVCEYLTKPVAFDQLLERAEQIFADSRGSDSANGLMIGSSAALVHALDQAERAAQSDADILIEAESGTGKELLARGIHTRSRRRKGPFVAVNCAALPEALLESELFGHRRGAFTGATAAQQGKFEAANGGTLLLDEIGELPLNLQPKLLRVLEAREFCRLGEHEPVRIDLRVIASTNRSLLQMVQQGRFRADLFYRLNVIPLTLPPLRKRREDIRELAEYFAHKFRRDQTQLELSDDVLRDFERYDWPGNIRELANVVRRMAALGRGGPLTASAPTARPSVSPQTLTAEAINTHFRAGVRWHAAEKQLLESTLAATSGNRSRAAEMLGISLRTVRNKIREYNLPARSAYAGLHD